MSKNKVDAVDLIKPKFVRLDKRKRTMLELWLNPNSDYWGNAYQAAVQAGFSEHYARVITTTHKNIEWVQQGKALLKQFTPLHVVAGFQHEASTAKDSRDRIQALDRLAKIHGMYIERSQSEVNVSFTNNVPRPIVDATYSVGSEKKAEE